MSGQVSPTRRQLTVRASIGVVALGAVVIATWAFGGLREAAVGPDRLEPRDKVTGQRFSFRPLRAAVTDQKPGSTTRSPDERFLTITLAVTNVSRESAAYLDLERALLVRLRSRGELRQCDATFTGDLRLRKLQPRLTERVTAVWQLPANKAVPQRVTLVIKDHSYSTPDPDWLTPSWALTETLAVAMLPVAAAQGHGG